MTNQYTVCRVKYVESKWNINVRTCQCQNVGLVTSDASEERPSASSWPLSFQLSEVDRQHCQYICPQCTAKTHTPLCSPLCLFSLCLLLESWHPLAFQKNSLCLRLLLFISQVLFDSLLTPWIAAGQAPLSFTIFWSLLKFMSVQSGVL